MENEIEAVKESMKAAQEVAKTGRVVVEAGSDLAKWAAKVLGTLLEDVVGLAIGDHVHQVRIRNLDKISRKTDEILQKRQVENPEPIGMKQAIPFFEAASEESDETLQELWARLLANAMDPNRDIDMQRIFIDTLKQFEPIDALVLDKLNTLPGSQREAATIRARIPGDIRPSLVQLSLDRLLKLECTTMHGGRYQPRALGEELWNATYSNG